MFTKNEIVTNDIFLFMLSYFNDNIQLVLYNTKCSIKNGQILKRLLSQYFNFEDA